MWSVRVYVYIHIYEHYCEHSKQIISPFSKAHNTSSVIMFVYFNCIPPPASSFFTGFEDNEQ
jgi:hypothetical protein